MSDIRQWLEELGLGQYADGFEENDVDSTVLLKLTADDLRDIGIKSVGHRRKLLEAITIRSADSGNRHRLRFPRAPGRDCSAAGISECSQ